MSVFEFIIPIEVQKYYNWISKLNIKIIIMYLHESFIKIHYKIQCRYGNQKSIKLNSEMKVCR
jgi:hypothetical protein